MSFADVLGGIAAGFNNPGFAGELLKQKKANEAQKDLLKFMSGLRLEEQSKGQEISDNRIRNLFSEAGLPKEAASLALANPELVRTTLTTAGGVPLFSTYGKENVNAAIEDAKTRGAISNLTGRITGATAEDEVAAAAANAAKKRIEALRDKAIEEKTAGYKVNEAEANELLKSKAAEERQRYYQNNPSAFTLPERQEELKTNLINEQIKNLGTDRDIKTTASLADWIRALASLRDAGRGEPQDNLNRLKVDIIRRASEDPKYLQTVNPMVLSLLFPNIGTPEISRSSDDYLNELMKSWQR